MPKCLIFPTKGPAKLEALRRLPPVQRGSDSWHQPTQSWGPRGPSASRISWAVSLLPHPRDPLPLALPSDGACSSPLPLCQGGRALDIEQNPCDSGLKAKWPGRRGGAGNREGGLGGGWGQNFSAFDKPRSWLCLREEDMEPEPGKPGFHCVLSA